MTSRTYTKGLFSGTRLLGFLLALYYGTVVLAGIHIAVVQIVTLWGVALIFIPAYRASLSHRELGLLLSMIAIFLVAVLSYVVNGLWDQPDANLSRYARFLFFIPIYFVARNFATAAGFWTALLLGTLATGIWGVLEFAGFVSNPDMVWPEVNGAVNPIQYGDLSLTMAMMVCSGIPVYRQQCRLLQAAAGFAIVFALFSCFASNTRGAWIAIPALGSLVVWGLLRGGIIHMRQGLWATIIGITLIVTMAPTMGLLDQVKGTIKEVRDYGHGEIGESVGGRFEMWRASWEIFKEQPILGVGPDLYHSEVQSLMAERGGYDIEALTFSHPHSEYLFVLATLGSLGILSEGLLFLVPLYGFGRALLSSDDNLRWPGLAGTVLIVGYLHFGMTEALMFQHTTFLGFYLLSVAVLATLIHRRQQELARGGI